MESRNLFDSPAGYAGFVGCKLRFYTTMTQALRQAGLEDRLPEFCQRSRFADLAADGEFLGLPRAAPAPGMVAIAGLPGLLGALYVMEGSALGARVLAPRALALGYDERGGARYLVTQARTSRWPAYRETLDTAILPMHGERLMEAAARQTFGYMARLLASVSPQEGLRDAV